MISNWTDYYRMISHEPDLLREAEKARLAHAAEGEGEAHLPGDVQALVQAFRNLQTWLKRQETYEPPKN